MKKLKPKLIINNLSILKTTFFVWLFSLFIFFGTLDFTDKLKNNKYSDIGVFFLLLSLLIGVVSYLLLTLSTILYLIEKSKTIIKKVLALSVSLFGFISFPIVLLLIIAFLNEASFMLKENQSPTERIQANYLINKNKTNINSSNNTYQFYNEVANSKQQEWGVAKQIDDVTWQMKIGMDERIGTPQEIFDALNNYRNRHGVGTLSWDVNLANFAQQRAETFNSLKKLDKHAGFDEFSNNPDNIRNLGFKAIGENSSYGYRLYGVHLIEWIFAGDEPHNKNQLDPFWNYVGVGVSGLGVDIIFGNK